MKVEEIILILIKEKKFIFFSTCIAAILSIIIALSLPSVYQSRATLEPVSLDGSDISSMSSNLGGIASLAGINLGSSGNSATLAIEKIRSRDFFAHLLSFEISKKNLPNVSQQMEPQNKFNEEAYISYLRDLSIQNDIKNGFIRISYKHRSPEFSQKFLLQIIEETNQLARLQGKAESEESIAFLTGELQKTSLLEIKNAISSLIENEFKGKMVANVKQDYLLKIIDSPYLPQSRHSPSRALTCIFITLLGFILSILYPLVKELSKNFKNKYGDQL